MTSDPRGAREPLPLLSTRRRRVLRRRRGRSDPVVLDAARGFGVAQLDVDDVRFAVVVGHKRHVTAARRCERALLSRRCPPASRRQLRPRDVRAASRPRGKLSVAYDPAGLPWVPASPRVSFQDDGLNHIESESASADAPTSVPRAVWPGPPAPQLPPEHRAGQNSGASKRAPSEGSVSASTSKEVRSPTPKRTVVPPGRSST